MQVSRRQFLRMTAASLGAMALPGPLFAPSAMAGQRILPSWPVARYTPQELKKLRIGFFPDANSPRLPLLYRGMQKHGLNLSTHFLFDTADVDLFVVGGWWHSGVIRAAQKANKNMLVMEGGFFEPRKEQASLGFNGLNGYATFAPAGDNGERFRKYHGNLLQPWRKTKTGYALLIGQVPEDKAMHGLHMYRWLQKMTDHLLQGNIEVVYRPHPRIVERFEKQNRELIVPHGARISTGSLEKDLDGAAYTVIYSSTTAVESIMAGVPAVVMSKGSVAWPVTSHDLDKPFHYPDRTQWCNNLAWRQWSNGELENGMAWEHTSKAILV